MLWIMEVDSDGDGIVMKWMKVGVDDLAEEVVVLHTS